MKEPFLEPILRRMRLRKVIPTIRQYPNCSLLDVGCGWDYLLLRTIEPFIGSGMGIDFKVRDSESPRIKTKQMMMTDSLPFESESFDIVTMLAVLEHLSEPMSMMREIRRTLKHDGRLLMTVPSKISQPILEFLAYRLRIVNVAEIRDHKKYYDYEDLEKLFSGTGMIIESHRYFQIGMNNFCIVKK